jgi:hypothetical protein
MRQEVTPLVSRFRMTSHLAGMNSQQLGRDRDRNIGGQIVGPRRTPQASRLGSAGCLMTLVLSSAVAACTVTDPILDQQGSGYGGSVYPGTGGRQPLGVGGSPEPGTGGEFSGVGGSVPPGTGGEPGLGGRTGEGGAPEGLGGEPGSGGRQVLGTGGAPGVGGAPGGSDCDQQLTLFDCNARPDCHAVFFDPGTCNCASLGCCAQFHHCASGFNAICTGLITCAVLPPHCESPYLISYRDGCYEGCVHYRDCPP